MVRSTHSRKRKRQGPSSTSLRSSSSSSSSPSKNPSHSGVRTIRTILGRGAKIYCVPEFLRLYAPSFELRLSPEHRASKDFERLQKTIISPLDSIQVATNPVAAATRRRTECRESVSSLVNGVISSLVQRRERMKRQGLLHARGDGKNHIINSSNNNNLLIQGYVVDSEHRPLGAGRCPTMPGVIYNHLNQNVSFCKTSQLIRLLHLYVGDEVLRMILLHTRMFVPVEKAKEDDEMGNDTTIPPSTTTQCDYMLICGPTIPAGRSSSTSSNNQCTPLVNTNANNNRKRKDGTPNDHVNNHPRLEKKRKLTSSGSTQTEKVPRKMQPNSTMARRSLFYSNSYIPQVGLPSKHVMNHKCCSAEQLLDSMVDLFVKDNKGGVKRRKKRWKRLGESGISVCEAIQQGHARCDYHRLLERYCPLPATACKKRSMAARNSNPVESSSVSLPALAQAFTPAEKVASFLTAVLRRVFPPAFWGSELNFLRILETVQTFVRLRRKEQLANKTLMKGLRVTKMHWLVGGRTTSSNTSRMARTDHQATTTLALSVMRWLFRSFIIPLLRSNFYVTETEMSAQQIVFYRKPVWSMFRSLSMSKLLQKQFVEIQGPEAAFRAQTQKLGFSRLRLLPKATGVRPIAQLSMRVGLADLLNRHLNRPTLVPPARAYGSDRFRSTNAVLDELFQVLKYECKRKPTLYGAGLDSLGEFYPRYRQFITAVKQARTSTSKELGIFFASVDIEKCYDNIQQDHLLDVTRKELSEDFYLIQQTKLIRPPDRNQTCVQMNKKHIGPPEAYHPLHPAAVGFKGQSTGSVYVNTVKCSLVKKENILALLDEHLRSNLLVVAGRYSDRYLVQANGISQGSVLSTLLCNLYYADVEKRILCERYFRSGWTNDSRDADVPGSINLLTRLVDDFIFISTSQDELTTFLTRMKRGNPEFGAKINEEKTVVSTTVHDGTDSAQQAGSNNVGDNRDKSCSGLRMFPWCGMLFSTHTGEVFLDYSRFANGKTRDALTVDRAGAEGSKLPLRMQAFVRPRCLPILFDSAINGLKAVITNYYQMMLLGAVKTAEYLRSSEISFTNKANTDFFLRCIEQLSSMALGLIRRGLKQLSFGSAGCDKFSLSTRTTSWLCWRAFCDVFCQLADYQHLSPSLALELSRKGQHAGMRGAVECALDQFRLHGLLPSTWP
jgi:hypothetical protein